MKVETNLAVQLDWNSDLYTQQDIKEFSMKGRLEEFNTFLSEGYFNYTNNLIKQK